MQSRLDSENNQDSKVDITHQADVLEFDPCNLTKDQSKVFNLLLKQFYEQGFSTMIEGVVELDQPNVSVHSSSAEIKFRIINCKELVYRKCSSSSFGYHYEILGSLLGEGSDGEVYSVLGALVPQADGSLKLIESKRVYKIVSQNLSDKKELDEKYKDIYQMLINVKHLHVKPPLFCVSSKKSYVYLAMRLLPGQQLCNWIDWPNFKDNTNLVLHTARAILRAAKSQIIDARLVHADIKPENILFDGKAMTINFIDFDRAHLIPKNLFFVRGTPYYAAPEIYLDSKGGGTGTTPESDIYSLGITVAELFAGLSDETTLQHVRANAKAEGITARFSPLFVNCTDLIDEHKNRIECLLSKMTWPDPARRCTVEYAIRVFEEVINERFYQQLSKYLPSYPLCQAITAINGALQFRDMTSASALKINYAQPQANDDLLTEYLNAARMLLPDVQIPSFVWDHMMLLQDSKCFIGLRDKNEVIEKIKSIRFHYKNIISTLDANRDRYQTLIISAKQKSTASNDLKFKDNLKEMLLKVQDYITYLDQKIKSLNEKYSVSLDNIIIMTDKLKKYQDKGSNYYYALYDTMDGTRVDPLSIYSLFKPLQRQQAQPLNADHSSTLPQNESLPFDFSPDGLYTRNCK